MNEEIIAFIIWSLVGSIMILLGVFTFFSKKAVGFWSNIKMIEVTDVKKYNNSVGTLFITFGFIFILLGLPLLFSENEIYIIFSMLGVVFEVILTMVTCTLVIENKYGKK